MNPKDDAPSPPAPRRSPLGFSSDALSLSEAEEARVFWRMRKRMVWTLVRQTFARSRFRLGLVLLLSIVLWGALFWLFADAFWFLKLTISHARTHDELIRGIFGMFFAALMVMLVFSTGIILYSSLFRSQEIAFLLTTPARAERVFLYKFQESIVFSSWAFLLLSSPMLLAYGIVARAPWYYYALLGPLLVAFTYIPTALGAILCLEIVYRLPRRRTQVLWMAGVVAAAGLAWLGWSMLGGPRNDLLTPRWFQEMFSRLRVTEGRLLPNWWLSSGILQATRGAWAESVLFLTVLLANALLLRQVAVGIAGRIYREAYSGLADRSPRRRRVRQGRLDGLLLGLRGLSMPMRLMIVKDLRLFRRDPVQWSQFLIFFGLLLLYFLNIRRFSYDIYQVAWVNMISFLNLSVVGLLMSTFTTRFIFPMISLEGRRFWILGLLPIKRETILWGKFFFSAGGAIVPCASLVLLSDLMLRVSPLVLAMHQLACVLLSVGLAGIAVGLGARLPSLREQSPSRIAAGFGGTLNLVVSTMYILAIVVLTALPCHFYLVAQSTPATQVLKEPALVEWWIRIWLVAGIAASILLGAAATVVPLRIGFRAFREMEF